MSSGPRWCEVAAVVATALLFLLSAHVLDVQGPFTVLAMLGWAGYAALRARREPGVLRRWGLGRAGLRPTLLATTLLASLALPAMAAVGHARGTLALNGHLLALLLLYPLWGLVQQLLVQALVAGNLARAGGRLASPLVVVPVAALLFGLVHLPDGALSVATFGLGLLFTPMYLAWRNLWPLGMAHGWLGACFYFWVLGRDPFLDLVG